MIPSSLRVPLANVATFIAHVDPIIALHQNFFLALQSTQNEGEGIAAAYLTTIPFFSMYREYVYNYDNVTSLLASLRGDNDAFAAFLDEVAADPRSGGRSLSGVYIMPVQRLPRYVLLLKELLSAYERDLKQAQANLASPLHTPAMQAALRSDAGFESLQTETLLLREALAAMELCARGVNEAQKEIEGQARLRDISTRLGKKYLSLQLAHPSRRLVKEALLRREKKGRGKEARVILCNDMLVWLTDYEFKGAMPLDRVAFKASTMSKPAYVRPGLSFDAPASTVSEWFIDLKCLLDDERISSPQPDAASPQKTIVYSTLTKDVMFPPLAPHPATPTTKAGTPATTPTWRGPHPPPGPRRDVPSPRPHHRHRNRNHQGCHHLNHADIPAHHPRCSILPPRSTRP